MVKRDLTTWIVVQHPEQLEHVGVIGRELVRGSIAADDNVLAHRFPIRQHAQDAHRSQPPRNRLATWYAILHSFRRGQCAEIFWVASDLTDPEYIAALAGSAQSSRAPRSNTLT